jgi:hypothetical protein
MGKEEVVDTLKHTEQIEYVNYNSEEEDFLEEEDEEDDKEEDRQFNIICKTRLFMIKYIEENALPLGSLLDQNAIENFILSILQ